MRSRQMSLERYDTDKVANGYLSYYDEQFQHLVDSEITLLEIGVKNGGSLLLWRDYFPNGNIVGIDVELPRGLTDEARIKMFQGSQGHESFLRKVAEQTAPQGFDVIIDDGSHIGRLSKRTFWLLFEKHLKASGLYVIEDWGTGYWADWPDGKPFRETNQKTSKWSKLIPRKWQPSANALLPSHSFGMVGFVKQLIDEQGAADLSRARADGSVQRCSRFEKMVITPSIVFITKSAS